MPTRTVVWLKNGTCTCSPGRGICFFAFGIEIERRGWPPQPPTFSISFDPIFALKKKVLVKC